MHQSPLQFLSTHLADVELPDGLALVHPEDVSAHHDEKALSEFLREFRDDDEHMEIVDLYPMDQLG